MNSMLMSFVNLFCFIAFFQFSFAQAPETLTDSGKASFYHDDFHGLETSSGEEFDKNDFTAAHLSLPFNTIVCVTNLKNGKNAIVRINDRGPFNKKRILDVSPSAAKKLKMVNSGIALIRLQTLTLFDQIPFSDSVFTENQIWDCYGNLHSLTNTTVYIWESEFFKHAFYTATALALDYHIDSVVVCVKGPSNHRIYQVLATGLKEKNAATLQYQLRIDGYTNARILKIKIN
jgi:rare lipoprotein A